MHTVYLSIIPQPNGTGKLKLHFDGSILEDTAIRSGDPILIAPIERKGKGRSIMITATARNATKTWPLLSPKRGVFEVSTVSTPYLPTLDICRVPLQAIVGSCTIEIPLPDEKEIDQKYFRYRAHYNAIRPDDGIPEFALSGNLGSNRGTRNAAIEATRQGYEFEEINADVLVDFLNSRGYMVTRLSSRLYKMGKESVTLADLADLYRKEIGVNKRQEKVLSILD